jgi:hypothetical protein
MVRLCVGAIGPSSRARLVAIARLGPGRGPELPTGDAGGSDEHTSLAGPCKLLDPDHLCSCPTFQRSVLPPLPYPECVSLTRPFIFRPIFDGPEYIPLVRMDRRADRPWLPALHPSSSSFFLSQVRPPAALAIYNYCHLFLPTSTVIRRPS